MDPSWKLKLYRAEEHLRDLKALLATETVRKPHPVSKTLDPETQRWEYRLALDRRHTPSEQASTVAGDFLFNVRSALDHLAVAFVANENKGKVAFPIYADDPLALNPAGNGHLHAQAWSSWKGRTKCLGEEHPAALAAITALQPFEVAKRTGENPVHHPLAVLRALHDADEHAQLLPTIAGIDRVEIVIDGEATCWHAMFPDGTRFYTSPSEVDVQVVSAARIAFSISLHVACPFPETFDAILDTAANEVLPPLEKLLT